MFDDIVVVTRHPGAVDWLQRQGIQPVTVLPRVYNYHSVAQKNVVGILPLRYAITTANFGQVFMPYLPTDHEGELTCEEMVHYGARIDWFPMGQLFAPDGPLHNHALDLISWCDIRHTLKRMNPCPTKTSSPPSRNVSRDFISETLLQPRVALY